jgi:hypothetical protein
MGSKFNVDVMLLRLRRPVADAFVTAGISVPSQREIVISGLPLTIIRRSGICGWKPRVAEARLLGKQGATFAALV